MYSGRFELLLFLIIACLSLDAYSDAELEKGEKASVVVAPLKIVDSVFSLAKQEGRTASVNRIGDTLQSQFKTAINQTRVFNMVERDRLSDVNQEQSYQQAVSLDGAVEMGRMKGAGYLLFIEVDGFQDRLQTKTLGTGRTEALRSIYLSAQIRIVDAETGDTLPDIPTAIVEREVRKGQNDGLGQDQINADRIFVEMAQEAANVLCQKVIAYIRPGKILKVKENEIVINRGEPAGFTKGAIVEFYDVDEIVDEDTGEVFIDESVAGKARVVRANERSSYASPLEGDAREGQTAKVISPPPGPATAAPAQQSQSGTSGQYYSVPGF